MSRIAAAAGVAQECDGSPQLHYDIISNTRVADSTHNRPELIFPNINRAEAVSLI